MVNARTSRARASAKVTQMRAEQAKAERRRRLALAIGMIAVVVAVVVGLIGAKLAGIGNTKSAGSKAASASISADLARASKTLDSVTAGSVSNLPSAITAPALSVDGKPRILYVGAEYCPFCAAQRWAVAVALGRFGTWTGLGVTTSSSTDVYPNTPTLSFHGARLTSNHVTFTGVETTTNQALAGGGYQPLDTLSATDSALVNKYDAPPYVPASAAGSIPFVDIGGVFVSSGASYSPGLFAGKTQAQIAAVLKDPQSPIAEAVGVTANAITAAICRTTGGQPTQVCSASGVTAASSRLGHAG
jgi:hypothetical protein